MCLIGLHYLIKPFVDKKGLFFGQLILRSKIIISLFFILGGKGNNIQSFLISLTYLVVY
jgi:hypothetical protein